MSSVFHYMSNLVRVRDLQAPLGPPLQADQLVAIAFEDEELMKGDRISLVMRDGEAVGWIGLDMLGEGNSLVSEQMDPIQPGSVLSGDTPALEAVRLFTETARHFFFVLDHNRITGTLHYGDLFGLPFRLCLLALTFHLEGTALELAVRSPGESWQALSEGRKQKATDIYTSRYGRPPKTEEQEPWRGLLGCTSFTDKGTILRKRGLLRGISGEQLESTFARAERVRNSCAHTGSDDAGSAIVVERTMLRDFIDDMEALIKELETK